MKEVDVDPGPRDRRVRVGLFIDHPSQYFAPGLRALATVGSVDPIVYYWDSATEGVQDRSFGQRIRWHTDLHSGYQWWSPPAGTPTARSLALLRRLRRDRPRAILSFGWHSPVARVAITYATVTRTPLLFYGDTHPDFSATGRFDRIRPLVLRTLFWLSDGAVATGHGNRTFYLKNGMSAGKVHDGVLPADVDLFQRAAARARRGLEPVDQRPVVLGFVGKLIECKAVDDLLEAASQLPESLVWELRLIGDGPLREKLTRLADERGVGDRTSFLGFRNLDELPDLVADLDIVVLPSRRDNRGLAVVEAMSAGAAAIVSSATGVWGPGDVVNDGETGLVFGAGSVTELCEAMRRLIVDDGLRRRLAAAGKIRASLFGPKQFAATTAAALTAVSGR